MVTFYQPFELKGRNGSNFAQDCTRQYFPFEKDGNLLFYSPTDGKALKASQTLPAGYDTDIDDICREIRYTGERLEVLCTAVKNASGKAYREYQTEVIELVPCEPENWPWYDQFKKDFQV